MCMGYQLSLVNQTGMFQILLSSVKLSSTENLFYFIPTHECPKIYTKPPIVVRFGLLA